MGSGNGLLTNRHQASTLANDDSVTDTFMYRQDLAG